MDTVRLGVVGVGGMGGQHADSALAGRIPRCELGAVCDVSERSLQRFDSVPRFTDSAKMIRSGAIDAVLIATPHYAHTTVGIDALNNGLHVLVEKPISVHKADCERLLAAHRGRKTVFAAMFNQRSETVYRKIKKMVADGELGDIRRVSWIVTDWFRPEAYYASGAWRGTWQGEGGGVLINQCPHQLDLLQWIIGMPSRIHGFCRFGVRHDIEVEDEVTAYLEFPGGATGVFVTSTGEAPGTNRLEIVGDRGRLVAENGRLEFLRNEIPAAEFSRTTRELFAKPDVWTISIPGAGGGSHEEMTRNFVDAILDGTPVYAPAAEGIGSVEIANAIVYSSLTGKPVDIPLDAAAYERKLKQMIRTSTFRKKAAPGR